MIFLKKTWLYIILVVSNMLPYIYNDDIKEYLYLKLNFKLKNFHFRNLLQTIVNKYKI